MSPNVSTVFQHRPVTGQLSGQVTTSEVINQWNTHIETWPHWDDPSRCFRVSCSTRWGVLPQGPTSSTLRKIPVNWRFWNPWTSQLLSLTRWVSRHVTTVTGTQSPEHCCVKDSQGQLLLSFVSEDGIMAYHGSLIVEYRQKSFLSETSSIDCGFIKLAQLETFIMGHFDSITFSYSHW